MVFVLYIGILAFAGYVGAVAGAMPVQQHVTCPAALSWPDLEWERDTLAEIAKGKARVERLRQRLAQAGDGGETVTGDDFTIILTFTPEEIAAMQHYLRWSECNAEHVIRGFVWGHLARAMEWRRSRVDLILAAAASPSSPPMSAEEAIDRMREIAADVAEADKG